MGLRREAVLWIPKHKEATDRGWRTRQFPRTRPGNLARKGQALPAPRARRATTRRRKRRPVTPTRPGENPGSPETVAYGIALPAGCLPLATSLLVSLFFNL